MSPRLVLPPIKDEEEFEEFCKELLSRELPVNKLELNGRRGQRQDGVDLYGSGSPKAGGTWIGVQCKAHPDGLSDSEVTKDAAKARNFKPRIDVLIFATTAKRDARVQEHIRTQSAESTNSGCFRISSYFWEDLLQLLRKEEHLDILKRYFPQMLVNVLPDGVALSKLLRVEVGVPPTLSSYEIIIGKTVAAGSHEDTSLGMSYWKGLAFLINLNERKADIFRVPLGHWSDLDLAVSNRLDRFALKEWINSYESIDELLSQVDNECHHEITVEQYSQFLDRSGSSEEE